MSTNDYKIINYGQWPRRELFEFFSHASDPFYSVTFNLDVTRVYEYAKENGLSFYYALTWLVTRAVNSVEAFRYAKLDGNIVLLPERVPSLTDMKKGAEHFHIVTMPAGDDIKRFCLDAKRRSETQKEFVVMSDEVYSPFLNSSTNRDAEGVCRHERRGAEPHLYLLPAVGGAHRADERARF